MPKMLKKWEFWVIFPFRGDIFLILEKNTKVSVSREFSKNFFYFLQILHPNCPQILKSIVCPLDQDFFIWPLKHAVSLNLLSFFFLFALSLSLCSFLALSLSLSLIVLYINSLSQLFLYFIFTYILVSLTLKNVRSCLVLKSKNYSVYRKCCIV